MVTETFSVGSWRTEKHRGIIGHEFKCSFEPDDVTEIDDKTSEVLLKVSDHISKFFVVVTLDTCDVSYHTAEYGRTTQVHFLDSGCILSSTNQIPTTWKGVRVEFHNRPNIGMYIEPEYVFLYLDTFARKATHVYKLKNPLTPNAINRLEGKPELASYLLSKNKMTAADGSKAEIVPLKRGLFLIRDDMSVDTIIAPKTYSFYDTITKTQYDRAFDVYGEAHLHMQVQAQYRAFLASPECFKIHPGD